MSSFTTPPAATETLNALGGNGLAPGLVALDAQVVTNQTAVALRSLIASPTFTGTVTLPVGLSGMASLASGVVSAVTAPAGTIVGTTDTQTLSAKRWTRRVTALISHATPTVNTDNCDWVDITALAEAITSMTTNLTGTPTNKDILAFEIKDNGTARAITWGASFVAGGVTPPSTTVISKILTVLFEYSTANSLNKWRCLVSLQEV